jgi:hypothetical protein
MFVHNGLLVIGVQGIVFFFMQNLIIPMPLFAGMLI